MRGEVWMDIRSDRQKGLSYVEQGKKYHMDPRTAKRYAESPSRPEYTLTGPKPTKLDPYKQKIGKCHRMVEVSKSLPKKNKLIKVPMTAL